MAPQPPTTGQPRLATPLTDKLTPLVTLSPEAIAVLGDLQSTIRTVARNREIISEGRKYDGLLVLREGVSIRYRILHDGRRPGCFFESALYSITALTDCAVSAVPFARLLGFSEKYPRLAATIFWSFSREAAMYAEHLIDVGRRSALERVAHSCSSY